MRDIVNSTAIHFITTNLHTKWKFKKYPFLKDINDHKLIAEAAALKNHSNDVFFITADGT